jgi:predicted dithiol-disulfide oxidoreductase (DUF899 family)
MRRIMIVALSAVPADSTAMHLVDNEPHCPTASWEELSMGMTDDFEVAIEEGATPQGEEVDDDSNVRGMLMLEEPPDWLQDWGEAVGTELEFGLRENPSWIAFALEDGVVYHTYSTYDRGVEQLMGTLRILDLAPLGRNEETAGSWWQRHDEYEKA